MPHETEAQLTFSCRLPFTSLTKPKLFNLQREDSLETLISLKGVVLRCDLWCSPHFFNTRKYKTCNSQTEQVQKIHQLRSFVCLSVINVAIKEHLWDKAGLNYSWQLCSRVSNVGLGLCVCAREEDAAADERRAEPGGFMDWRSQVDHWCFTITVSSNSSFDPLDASAPPVKVCLLLSPFTTPTSQS